MPLPPLIEIAPLTAPVRAEITVPGSKSITNRALVLAAFLYLGSGTGITLIKVFQRARGGGRPVEAGIKRADLGWLAGHVDEKRAYRRSGFHLADLSPTRRIARSGR